MTERQAGSGHVAFAAYNVKPKCYGCGRKVTLAEPLWFRGGPDPAVFGRECFPLAPRLETASKSSGS